MKGLFFDWNCSYSARAFTATLWFEREHHGLAKAKAKAKDRSESSVECNVL